jgi:hypothetical protein
VSDQMLRLDERQHLPGYSKRRSFVQRPLNSEASVLTWLLMRRIRLWEPPPGQVRSLDPIKAPMTTAFRSSKAERQIQCLW